MALVLVLVLVLVSALILDLSIQVSQNTRKQFRLTAARYFQVVAAPAHSIHQGTRSAGSSTLVVLVNPSELVSTCPRPLLLITQLSSLPLMEATTEVMQLVEASLSTYPMRHWTTGTLRRLIMRQPRSLSNLTATILLRDGRCCQLQPRSTSLTHYKTQLLTTSLRPSQIMPTPLQSRITQL